ncbi:flavodoxin [Geomonas limicola]|uniref:Flavodoxin n=1 Tax=Geomonas limicola TaxID=2740186 RepID=A0A6V8N784_9BACT|nr:flavodoxin [Geomonas limicola]GFO67784.1 flavodoxin [Geomonas limicola]
MRSRVEAKTGNWKVLTIYFSHSGNTRECASQIHERLGGDLVEIVPVDPYPQDYDKVVDQAKRELMTGYKPLLMTNIENIESYDILFVGSPNWWNSVAPPIMTFLSQCDLTGKAIFPFITHEGTGLGQSAADIARLCPNATILEGLAVRGKEAKRAQSQISDWLRKLGM